MPESATKNVPVTVRIMDREYRIACPDGEQNDLLRAAELLNQRINEMREGSQIVGLERVVMLTALNLASDLLKVEDGEVGIRIQNLRQKLDAALDGSVE